MSKARRFIRREVEFGAVRNRLRGRVLSHPQFKEFDPSGSASPSWVVDVDIQGNRILRDVPVKVGPARSRSYARVGAPVFLERDARGRYQVVSPADRAPAQGNVRELDEETGLDDAAGVRGVTLRPDIFDFYKGDLPEDAFDPATDPDTLYWCQFWSQDADTVESGAFAEATDISGNGRTATQGTAGLRPLEVTGASLNGRTAADFDGLNDTFTLPSVIPGTALSIFAFLNKEATSSGLDVVIETEEFRLFSRAATTDNWGITAGTQQLSGRVLGGTAVLIEAIATDTSSVALYQDGISLGTFNTGTGLGLATNLISNDHFGKIYELLVIDRTVSDVDRLAIELYFQRQYNLNFARWNDGVTGFPSVTVLDENGNPL